VRARDTLVFLAFMFVYYRYKYIATFLVTQ
jgi:hypothetical protein